MRWYHRCPVDVSKKVTRSALMCRLGFWMHGCERLWQLSTVSSRFVRTVYCTVADRKLDIYFCGYSGACGIHTVNNKITTEGPTPLECPSNLCRNVLPYPWHMQDQDIVQHLENSFFKGILTQDFRPLFSSSNNFPWVPDTQIKAFSNMASN
jgi:hypothetical protein